MLFNKKDVYELIGTVASNIIQLLPLPFTH